VNKISRLLVLTPVVCLALSLPASGADHPIEGRKVLLRDPVNPGQRRFQFISKDLSITFGSNGDSDTPTTNGASVLLFNPVSGECQCMILPASGWKIGSLGKTYAYHDVNVVNSPIKLAIMKAQRLKVVGKGPGLSGVTLNETSQGEIAVHYTSGNANKLCADFSGLSIRTDRPQAFIGLNAPPPGACAPEPAACTPCVPPIVP
jgi:hypothetical protein